MYVLHVYIYIHDVTIKPATYFDFRLIEVLKNGGVR